MNRNLKLWKWLLSIKFCDTIFLRMKEQLFLVKSRVTETEQLSINRVTV